MDGGALMIIGKGGDAVAGFEVSVDLGARLVRTASWGLWTHELGVRYRDTMFRAFERMRGTSWNILSDRSRMLPQSDDVQQLFTEILKRATDLGRVRAAVLVDNAVTQLQIRRLGTETHVPEQRMFHHEAAALTWLRSEAESSRRRVE